MSWTSMQTSTHQDHVIAHVIGATPLGYFSLDETAYLLLDIGFIWNLYLNLEMGLLPHPVAIAELDAVESLKNELRSDVESLLQGTDDLLRMEAFSNSSPIVSAELFESSSRRLLRAVCEEGTVTIETSLENGAVEIGQPQMDADFHG